MAASGLYALLFAIAFPLELAYQFDRYGRMALATSAGLFLLVFITTLSGLVLDWKAVVGGRSAGLLRSIAAAVISASALYIMIRPALPAEPVTRASLLTRSDPVALG